MSGDTFAFQLANIVADLGMEIVGITPLHHDQKLDGGDYGAPEKLQLQGAFDDVPVHVCPRQPYLSLKHIKEANPDLLICRHNGVIAMGIMLGIPTLVEGNRNYSIAYDGILSLGCIFNNIKQRSCNVSKYVAIILQFCMFSATFSLRLQHFPPDYTFLQLLELFCN